MNVDLLQMSPAAGCGCKLPLQALSKMMAALDRIVASQPSDECIRVGAAARDDAALYELPNGKLLVLTIDFGTPVASDPDTWGRITTLNALSDVYAIGGTPALALSALGWPDTVEDHVLTRMMSAAVNTLSEASTILVGGHTITSAVPFLGFTIVGFADVGRVMLIKNCQPGDHLILTKPLGTGVITAAQKTGVASAQAVAESNAVMLHSNAQAATLATAVGIDAATDVTGFGLLGHLHNMLTASGCAATLDLSAVPVLSDARDLLRRAFVPHSAERNLFTLDEYVAWNDAPFEMRFLLADPQTSGGMLLSASDDERERFLSACASIGQMAIDIGQVRAGSPGHIHVTTDI